MLCYQGCIYAPNVGKLRQHIIAEAHNSKYSIHLGSNKMFCDLWEVYCFNCMTMDAVNVFDRSTNSKKMMVEHQIIKGMIQEIYIPIS